MLPTGQVAVALASLRPYDLHLHNISQEIICQIVHFVFNVVREKPVQSHWTVIDSSNVDSNQI